ncbi:MAG: hypothetical protein PHF97_07550 [Bacteroidales bacterium]|nr:hypothetical protein [Bacteroidales bacterium]
MQNHKPLVALIGAGTIGTALGNILAENSEFPILLHSIEEKVVDEITRVHLNSKYFPGIHLHQNLFATTRDEELEKPEIIFLAIPSVILMSYLQKIRSHLPASTVLVNLAKGFGSGNKTIVECIKEEFSNPVCTMKGPSFASEIMNHLPTGFTLGYQTTNQETEIPAPISSIPKLFKNTPIYLDYSSDIKGVEILSILKNIYAVAIGIVDAQFTSPNLRFLILTKAFREMRKALLFFGGKQDTLFNYCGFGDFNLTALNDLSRNRTLGLLIGKGFFTEHVSHELVLEGKTATQVFYNEISGRVNVPETFPIIAELYKIFNTKYDISQFVKNILDFSESE